jgi:serine protease
MTHRVKSFRLFALGCSTAALLGLTGCDQREDRIERAQDLGGAVLDQLTGVETASVNKLQDVPIEARAMAGRLEAASSGAEEPPVAARYVIGSIVAKPRDLPPPIAMASVMAEPQLVDEIIISGAPSRIVVLDDATMRQVEADRGKLRAIEGRKGDVTIVDPRVQPVPVPLGSRQKVLPRKSLRETMREGDEEKQMIEDEKAGIVRPPRPQAMIMLPPALTRDQQISALPKMRPEAAQRAMTMRAETLTRQLAAEDQMINTASKFGVAASIQRSRSGQMKIEIGSGALNPTQFTGESGPQSIYATDGDIVCDADGIAAAAENPLIAMECIIQDLQASGEFEYVERDYVFEHQMIRKPQPETPLSITPNDPLFDLQWHYRSQGDAATQSRGGAGFVDFWTKQNVQGAGDVVVAVVDTGLQMDHPDMLGSPNIMPGWDMISDPEVGNDDNGRDSDANDPGDACPAQLNFSDTYHGTHVAGTVGAGASNNGLGVAGGAWNIKIVPVRALGKCGGVTSDISDAIRWAAGTIPEYDEVNNEVWNENPADIINLSMGLFRADRSCPASMQDAIDAVTAEGVIVVAAAGNKRLPTEYFAPANCRNVVTVAAGDARGYLTPYSNYGDGVDILAPGGDLGRDDNGDKNPDGVLSTKMAENCFDPVTGASVAKCYYAYEQGTSMAAPHVAAALALIKSQRPDMTPTQLVDTLKASLTRIPEAQCMGVCSRYPGAEPSVDDPDMCLRPCGAGLLNLGNVDLSR